MHNPFALCFSTLLLLLSALPILASARKVTDPSKVPKNAILLSKVDSLTFREGKQTTSRRVAAVPQLSCVGPSNVCDLYTIDTMRCTNEGADYDAENIQWACRASLPEEFKLGSTEVACEGYASSDDPYVLKGSCGVEYRLLLTDKGEAKYGSLPGGSDDPSESGDAGLVVKFVFFVIFFVVLFVIIQGMVKACQRSNAQRRGNAQRPPWSGGGGGGAGGADDDDPPPPYDDNSSSPKRGKGARTYGTAGSSRTAGQQSQQQQGWRPGPISAGLAGAGLGYALGRNNNRTQQQQQPQRPGSSWFGGGGGSGSGSSVRSSSNSSGSRSSAPAFSSTRHESTGFGSTSRR